MVATASSQPPRSLDIRYILSLNLTTELPPASGPFYCARILPVAHPV
jgi:hypothetical protein